MSSILKVDTIQTAAGGTPTAADLGLNVSGSVLQVVQGQFNSYQVMSSTTFTDVTGFNATITPTSTSSKILITVTLSFFSPSGNPITSEMRVTRNGSTFGNTANTNLFWNGNWVTAAAAQAMPCNTQYLDSPSSTSALTYQVQARHRNNSTGIGKDWNSDNAGMHNIILIEIAG